MVRAGDIVTPLKHRDRTALEPRNLAGNPYSPEIVIFLASISVAMMGYSNGFHTLYRRTRL